MTKSMKDIFMRASEGLSTIAQQLVANANQYISDIPEKTSNILEKMSDVAMQIGGSTLLCQPPAPKKAVAYRQPNR